MSFIIGEYSNDIDNKMVKSLKLVFKMSSKSSLRGSLLEECTDHTQWLMATAVTAARGHEES